MENKEGRIHMIGDGSRAVFVFGNRYAPDVFEGRVPDHLPRKSICWRSGIVGTMTSKNTSRKDPAWLCFLASLSTPAIILLFGQRKL